MRKDLVCFLKKIQISNFDKLFSEKGDLCALAASFTSRSRMNLEQ